LKEDIYYQEIISLSNKGAIERVSDSEEQFLPSYFLRKSSGDWRFILNFKHLNQYILVPHFKMKNWRTDINLLSQDDFFATINLDDAYFLLLIYREDRKFLRFHF